MRHFIGCAVLLLALPLAWPGCGEEDSDDHAHGPPEGVGSIQRSLSTIDCATSTATGYTAGKSFPITVVTVDGKKVERASANAYYVMAQAAAKAGVGLKVVSGFRTMAEQTYLYNCYLNCNCNSCNLAAKPGYSNHQSGHALDLNTSAPGVLSWLNNHGAAYGWKRTVPSEAWHWEWWGGGPGGGPCVDKPTTWPVVSIDVQAQTISGQARDVCQLGNSAGVFDLFVGQEVEVFVEVKNGGTAAGKNVTVGITVEGPYLVASKWTIYSDGKGGGSFSIDDTDSMQKVPHTSPGKSFALNLGGLSVGETKRIRLQVKGGAATFGTGAGQADVRAHVSSIDDWYTKKDWDTAPQNVDGRQKQNGGNLRAAAPTTVLDQERCDQKDNDCDGQIDEDSVCDGPGSPADAATPAAEADAGPPVPRSPEAGPGQPPPAAATAGDSGCALPGRLVPVPGLVLALVALPLALVARPRRRR